MFTSIVLFTSLIWLHGNLIFRVHIFSDALNFRTNNIDIIIFINFNFILILLSHNMVNHCRLNILCNRFRIFNNRLYIFNNRLILKLTNLGIIYISNFIFSFSLSIFFFSIFYYHSPIRPINIVNLFRLHISDSILNFRTIIHNAILFSNFSCIFSYCIFNFRLSYLAITLSRIFMILPHYYIAIFASIYIRNTILITIISTWCKTKLSWTHYASSLAFFK